MQHVVEAEYVDETLDDVEGLARDRCPVDGLTICKKEDTPMKEPSERPNPLLAEHTLEIEAEQLQSLHLGVGRHVIELDHGQRLEESKIQVDQFNFDPYIFQLTWMYLWLLTSIDWLSDMADGKLSCDLSMGCISK